jgi:F-type H+-transporting ATPase subunit delta
MTSSSTIATIAEPYAQALLAIAKGKDLAAKFGEDAGTIRDTLAGSDALTQALDNPFVAPEVKKEILQRIFGDAIDPYFANFLKLLVDRKRVALLDAICAKYQDLLRQLTNTALVKVTTAVELNDAQRATVIEKAIAMSGAAQVDLETTIDADILGGVIIQVGSQTVDASLRGQLRRIALSLNAA